MRRGRVSLAQSVTRRLGGLAQSEQFRMSKTTCVKEVGHTTCRSILLVFEERLREHFGDKSAILSWISRHAALLMTMHRRVSDGRTPHEWHGTAWRASFPDVWRESAVPRSDLSRLAISCLHNPDERTKTMLHRGMLKEFSRDDPAATVSGVARGVRRSTFFLTEANLKC